MPTRVTLTPDERSFGFLLVHIVADAAARERTHACADQRALTPVVGVALADQSACERTQERAANRAIGRLAGLLFAGIGILRLAGGEREARGNRHDREFLH